jgi:hypothetical protein
VAGIGDPDIFLTIALPIKLQRLTPPAGLEPASGGSDGIRAFTTPQTFEPSPPAKLRTKQKLEKTDVRIGLRETTIRAHP